MGLRKPIKQIIHEKFILGYLIPICFHFTAFVAQYLLSTEVVNKAKTFDQNVTFIP